MKQKKTKAQPRGLAYLRVSTYGDEAWVKQIVEEAKKSGNYTPSTDDNRLASLEIQERAVLNKFEAMGVTVAHEDIITDMHSGADYVGRKGLKALRAKLATGKYQFVGIYHSSRLARGMKYMMALEVEAEVHGAEIVSATQDYARGSIGTVQKVFDQYVDEKERDTIMMRTLGGKKRKIENGWWFGAGPARYGYVFDKESGKCQIIEDEAEVVRRMFKMVASGLSCNIVARTFDREGIPAPALSRFQQRPERRGKWTHSFIWRAVRAKHYKGEFWVQDHTYIPEEKRQGKTFAQSELRLLKDVYPPIVTPKLWQQANDAMGKNKGIPARNLKKFDLLRGRVYCGVCGKSMYPTYTVSKKGRKLTHRYYRCSSHNDAVRTCTLSASLRADVAEQRVWCDIQSIVTNPEILEQRLRALPASDSADYLTKTHGALKVKIAKLKDTQTALLNSFTGSISASLRETLTEKVTQIDREIQGYQSTVEEIEGELAQAQDSGQALQSLIEFAHSLKDADLSNVSNEVRAKILDKFIHRIVFTPGNLTIYPRFGDRHELVVASGDCSSRLRQFFSRPL